MRNTWDSGTEGTKPNEGRPILTLPAGGDQQQVAAA
jgi:hypothetical protein